MNKAFYLILVLLSIGGALSAQEQICVQPGTKHTIKSEHLDEERDYWVSLPFRYSDTVAYPVIYVLDAEWRFDMVRHIVFDLGANDMVDRAIIVGIPFVEVEKKRGLDLTFSQSRNEYNGEIVDSTWYDATNSGGGAFFYRYLVEELIPEINATYTTNGHETLIGHSYGGYFGAYLLSLPHPFEVLHIYDPSIWFSEGEVIERFRSNLHQESLPVDVHITYQPKPLYHREKIETFIRELEGVEGIRVTKGYYPYLSHNGLYLDSFYEGIRLTHKRK